MKIMELRKLFSVTNLYQFDELGFVKRKHKMINLCGIKFKIKKKLPLEFESMIGVCKREFKKVNNNAKINIVNLIIGSFSEKAELFRLKSSEITFILSRKFFELDTNFISDFLLYPINGTEYSLVILEKTDNLYAEHIKKFKKGELCWKYSCKFNHMSCTTVLKKDDKILLKRNTLGNTNGTPKHMKCISSVIREYISGVSLMVRMNSLKTDLEKHELITKFFDWFFENYKCNEYDNKILPEYWDCHFYNFIESIDGKFYFIDPEYYVDFEIDRGFCIYYSILHSMQNENLYKYLISHYKLEDKRKVYENQVYQIFNEPSELMPMYSVYDSDEYKRYINVN